MKHMVRVIFNDFVFLGDIQSESKESFAVSEDDSQLMELENRIRRREECNLKSKNSRETRSQPPITTSRTQYHTREAYASPDKDASSLNSYLMKCNLAKSNTEDSSFDIFHGQRRSRESGLNTCWSGTKHHASTSRIHTCPRYDRERSDVLSSGRSNRMMAKGHAILPQSRRSINRSMYFQQNTTRNYYLRESVPESVYKLDYSFKYDTDRKYVKGREHKLK